MHHVFSRLLALLSLVVAGLTVAVLPIAPAAAAPELSSTCGYINDPGFDTTTIGTREGRQFALFSSGGDFYAGEKIRFDFSAGGLGNQMYASFSIYDGDAEEYVFETSAYAYGTDAHSFTFTIPHNIAFATMLVIFNMEEGTSTGTLKSLCYQPHDTDSDGVDDVFDNCVGVPNGNQKDTDKDGKGDLCDDEPVPGPEDQTITFDQPGNPVVAGPGLPVVASSTSGLPVYFGVDPLHTGRCQVLNGLVKGLSAGECTIYAFQPGSPDFKPAPLVERTITVGKGTQTITFHQPANLVAGGENVPLSATSTAGLFVGFSSQTPGTCTVSAGRAYPVAGGTCTIAANQPGNVNYLAAPEVTKSLNVAMDTQKITFVQPADVTIGGNDGTLMATSDSGLDVTLTSLTPATCSIVSGKVRGLSAGNCTLAADQAGDASYAAAPQKTRTLMVLAGAQTISFDQPGAATFGGPDVALAATASSGLTVAFTSLTPSTCSVLAGKAHPLTVGSCTIAADQSGNNAFLAAPRQTRTLTITKGELVITTSAEVTRIHPKPRHAYVSVVRSAATGQPVAGIVVTTSVPRSGSAAFGCTATTNSLGVAACHSTDYYAVPTRRTYTATVNPSANYLGASASAPLPSAF